MHTTTVRLSCDHPRDWFSLSCDNFQTTGSPSSVTRPNSALDCSRCCLTFFSSCSTTSCTGRYPLLFSSLSGTSTLKFHAFPLLRLPTHFILDFSVNRNSRPTARDRTSPKSISTRAKRKAKDFKDILYFRWDDKLKLDLNSIVLLIRCFLHPLIFFHCFSSKFF